MSFIAQLKGKECLVVGAGITGQAVAKTLIDFGAQVIFFDEKVKQSQTQLISEIDSIPSTIELVIVSPGWRKDHPVVKKMIDAGATVKSELDLAWLIKKEIAPDQKWVGLTGTNGKTTTIQMVQSIFDAA